MGDEDGVQLHKPLDSVLAWLGEASFELLAEVAKRDPLTRRAYDSYVTFYNTVREYHMLSEQVYLQPR